MGGEAGRSEALLRVERFVEEDVLSSQRSGWRQWLAEIRDPPQPNWFRRGPGVSAFDVDDGRLDGELFIEEVGADTVSATLSTAFGPDRDGWICVLDEPDRGISGGTLAACWARWQDGTALDIVWLPTTGGGFVALDHHRGARWRTDGA